MGEITMDGRLIDIIGEMHPDYKHYKVLRENGIPLQLMIGMSDKQKKLYKLIHPDGEGLDLNEAAKKLNKSIQGVRKMKNTIEKNFPNAFMFERVEALIVGDANDIKNIYIGYKRIAETKGLDFNLSLEELEEIVKLPCYECESEPTKDTVNTKISSIYKRHHLGRWDTSKGYDYVNCKSVCELCIRKSR